MQGHSTPRLSAPCGFHGNRTLCPHCRLDLRSVPSNTALLGCDAIKTFHSIPPERRPSPEFSGSLIFSCLAPLLCPLPPCSGLKSLPVQSLGVSPNCYDQDKKPGLLILNRMSFLSLPPSPLYHITFRSVVSLMYYKHILYLCFSTQLPIPLTHVSLRDIQTRIIFRFFSPPLPVGLVFSLIKIH